MKRRDLLKLLGIAAATSALPGAGILSSLQLPAIEDPDLEVGQGLLRLPNGLLIQWGQSRNGGVAFPVAFQVPPSVTLQSPSGDPMAVRQRITCTSFVTEGSCQWLAIGH